VGAGITWTAVACEAATYAHGLYASLRSLDESGCDVIIVEKPPQTAEWAAINDRLTRAAAGAGSLDDV